MSNWGNTVDYRWGVRIFYNGGGPGWRNKRGYYTSVILGPDKLAFTSATRVRKASSERNARSTSLLITLTYICIIMYPDWQRVCKVSGVVTRTVKCGSLVERKRLKTVVFKSKTTFLHVHHAFLYISLPSLRNYDTNDQILSWLENGNGKAINFTISLWTQKRSPLFSSNLGSLLSCKQVTWYKGE